MKGRYFTLSVELKIHIVTITCHEFVVLISILHRAEQISCEIVQDSLRLIYCLVLGLITKVLVLRLTSSRFRSVPAICQH